MKTLIGCAAVFLILATATSAEAKGCIKGALVGGTAGHFAGHHGLIGAAAGCVVGRLQANKRAKCSTVRLAEEMSAFSAALSSMRA
jgi:hypothetical protein